MALYDVYKLEEFYVLGITIPLLVPELLDGKAYGYTGLCVGGIFSYSRWEPGSADMASPGDLLTQSFVSITCFVRAIHAKGAIAILSDKGFLGLAGVLGNAEHFSLLHKWKITFEVSACV